MKASNLCNSIKIRREIASDLVLRKGNIEKQTILAIVCTKTSTRAMKKITIMIFIVFLIFIISISIYGHVDWEVVTLDEHTWFMIKSVLFEYVILFFQYGRQNEIVIYSIIHFQHV